MMNNKSSGNFDEDIVLNPNGETYNPISLNPFVTLKLICCLVGIPLNVTTAVTILRHRRLRCKPRNIFLLGITLSFLTFFIPAMIELVYRILLPIDPLCRAYVAFVGLPHGLLLFNMSLALTDRFVAINYPLLHREKQREDDGSFRGRNHLFEFSSTRFSPQIDLHVQISSSAL